MLFRCEVARSARFFFETATPRPYAPSPKCTKPSALKALNSKPCASDVTGYTGSGRDVCRVINVAPFRCHPGRDFKVMEMSQTLLLFFSSVTKKCSRQVPRLPRSVAGCGCVATCCGRRGRPRDDCRRACGPPEPRSVISEQSAGGKQITAFSLSTISSVISEQSAGSAGTFISFIDLSRDLLLTC